MQPFTSTARIDADSIIERKIDEFHWTEYSTITTFAIVSTFEKNENEFRSSA